GEAVEAADRGRPISVVDGGVADHHVIAGTGQAVGVPIQAVVPVGITTAAVPGDGARLVILDGDNALAVGDERVAGGPAEVDEEGLVRLGRGVPDDLDREGLAGLTRGKSQRAGGR